MILEGSTRGESALQSALEIALIHIYTVTETIYR